MNDSFDHLSLKKTHKKHREQGKTNGGYVMCGHKEGGLALMH